MSLAEQIQRVDGGQNDTLKAILTALGVTVNGQKIDQLAALAAQISPKLKPENIASQATLGLYGLGSGAVPDDVLEILSKAALVGEDGGLSTPGGQGLSQVKVVAGTYIGDGRARKSLTFSGEVQLIVVNGESHYNKPTMVVPKGAQECHVASPFSGLYVNAYITWYGNTVSFSMGTLTESNSYMNVSGQTYYYLAILL